MHQVVVFALICYLSLFSFTFSGMIADSKGDTFPRPLDLTLQNGEQFFDFSKTSISVQYFSSQSIERNLPKETKSLASFLFFLVPSLSFALLFLAETVLYFSCLVLFSFGRAAISTRILIGHLDAKGLKMKSLHISFLIFLFLISSMFSSNLNTSNLIVGKCDDQQTCFLYRCNNFVC